MDDQEKPAGTYDLAATFSALEHALGVNGTTITLGDSDPFSLRDWHAGIEARIAALEAENRQLSAENSMLRVDAEESEQLRAELACAKQAAAFRRRKPTKTMEYERDTTGAIVRAHLFMG